jgi:small conductance mechanosensitive channel
VKTLTKILPGLLMTVCITSHSLAQSAGNAETEDIQALIKTLNADITDLKFLSEKIASAEKMDHTVLVYRQDERSFRLLTDFDSLVTRLTDLPEGASNKQEVESQLTELSEGVAEAIFNRINEIKQRIILSDAELGSLSGGTLIAKQAYINSLEAIRIKYYETLISHLSSRKSLGLSSENLLDRLTPNIHLYAETLAGRIEQSDATSHEVRARIEDDPDNADINSALKKLNATHQTNVHRLEALILVLDNLGLDSSDYKAVMLQQAGNISLSLFSVKAISSVLKDSWASLRNTMKENAPDMFFRFVLFMVILLIFRVLSRITRRVVSAASDRSALDLSVLLKNILVSTSGGLVMGLGVLMALSQVGISLAPMLAGLGVAGFIVGFALQDTLGNFAAGAMILIYRPFDVDDFVEVTGASGLVKKMNLVSTTITTFDNQTLVIPNSKIWGDVIKNVTAQKERRVDLEFGIGYDDDIEHAERVLTEIVSAHEKVLKQPEPTIKLHTLGDSSVNFIVRPWTKTEDYWDVYWDILREVKLHFDHEGISIPYPQRDVHLYSEKET